MNYGDHGRSNYRNDYGSQYGTGNYGQRDGSNYGQDYRTGNKNQNWQRSSGQTENRYGGDTRNHGNANQGGYDRDWWDRTRDEVSSWFGDDDAERRRRMDRQENPMEKQKTWGSHRGKGPKDYQRSEDRIREDVCDRLSDDDRLDASDIQVQVQGTEVILSGNVNNREEKRRAEDLVESISGVRNVENRIRISHGNERSNW